VVDASIALQSKAAAEAALVLEFKVASSPLKTWTLVFEFASKALHSDSVEQVVPAEASAGIGKRRKKLNPTTQNLLINLVYALYELFLER
jgi:hypothetical protein